MVSDSNVPDVLKELGMRIGAAVVVVGVFAGLGYVNRTNLFGLSSILDTREAFFAVAFLVIGAVTVGWFAFQQYRQ